jgi:hypothetical protein
VVGEEGSSFFNAWKVFSVGQKLCLASGLVLLLKLTPSANQEPEFEGVKNNHRNFYFL